MNDSEDILFDDQLIGAEELALSAPSSSKNPSSSFSHHHQPLPSLASRCHLSQTPPPSRLRRDKDFGTVAPDHHKTSSKIQNGVSSIDPIVETTVKANRVKTEMVSHQEAQDSQNNDVPSYLDLSQKLLAVWGSSTDKKLGSDAVSKLLVRCQGDFHILFCHMSMSLPSEITRKLLIDINFSGVSLHDAKDCYRTPEAAKVSHLYLTLTKIADGADILETLIEPLLDLCDMENVVVVRSSLCILHTLLKLILELETNFGRRS